MRLTEKGREAYELHDKYVYDKIFSRAAPILEEIPDEYVRKFCEVLDVMSEFPHLLREKEEQAVKMIPVNESK